MKKVKFTDTYPNSAFVKRLRLGAVNPGEEIDTGLTIRGFITVTLYEYEALIHIFKDNTFSNVVSDVRNLVSVNPVDPKFCFWSDTTTKTLRVKNNYIHPQFITIYYLEGK